MKKEILEYSFLYNQSTRNAIALLNRKRMEIIETILNELQKEVKEKMGNNEQ